MANSEVVAMLGEALQVMGIGVGGVFALLAVLYGALKAMRAIYSKKADDGETSA